MNSTYHSDFPKEIISGAFVRQESSFRKYISKRSEFSPDPERYHIYLCHACPWAHRVLITLKLKELDRIISHSFVDPIRDESGWKFDDDKYIDKINNFNYLSEAYHITDKNYNKRVTVPVLWDKKRKLIINNESSEIIEILNNEFEEYSNRIDYLPLNLLKSMLDMNDYIYTNINNGVYKCGFATNQKIYNDEVKKLFSALELINSHLKDKKYLFGDVLTLTDIRLFVTLIRFDMVYYSHFKTSIKRIYNYDNLWNHTKRIYNHDKIRNTVKFDEIKRHYFLTHKQLNPSKIIPATDYVLDLLNS
tara:strand:+ start:105 stop:1019 length:915 start_codon:yes stop_codon:yes gene_type:complete